MNEKPLGVRSPEPRVAAAPETEDLIRVAEIVLGGGLENRDRLAGFGTAESATSSLAQAEQTTGIFFLISAKVLKLMGRAIDIARNVYGDAVAQMQRLTFREDADTEADAREAIREKSPAEGAERKPAEEKLAAVAAAHRDDARQAAEEKATDGAAREVAEAQARAAQEAAKRQDARLKAQEAARKAAEVKLTLDAEAKEQAERAEADLTQEPPRTQALAQQLAARDDEQKLLAQERARTHALAQQLAAREDEQKLLAQERVRTQALEQQRSIWQNHQELLAPEAPGNLEAERLVAQARLLLLDGNIIAARSVLERASESGSALALFFLAETYDPASLSAWGLFGRRGNVTKARELYAKAVAGGVHGAKYRLSALH
jgi:hypothetical protein